MSELKALLTNVGEQFADRVQAHIAWDALSPEGQVAVKALAADRAQLAIRGLAGEDVLTELAFVDSTIADWAWVGADHAREALVQAAKEGAAILGQLLGAGLKGLL